MNRIFRPISSDDKEEAQRVIRPPSGGSSVQPAKHLAWEVNLNGLIAGAFGDPLDPGTMIRYWKAQEAAGYPYASENVKYFEELVQKNKEQLENDPGWYLSMRPCSVCKHRTVPVHAMPCRVCIEHEHSLWEEDANQ